MDILDVSWSLKLEAEFAPKGLAKIFCSEDFDFRPLRAASCALRRERRDRDWIEVVVLLPPLLDEKHANEEQLFYLWSKHLRTSAEDSIFFRESSASPMDTCLMFRSSRN